MHLFTKTRICIWFGYASLCLLRSRFALLPLLTWQGRRRPDSGPKTAERGWKPSRKLWHESNTGRFCSKFRQKASPPRNRQRLAVHKLWWKANRKRRDSEKKLGNIYYFLCQNAQALCPYVFWQNCRDINKIASDLFSKCRHEYERTNLFSIFPVILVKFLTQNLTLGTQQICSKFFHKQRENFLARLDVSILAYWNVKTLKRNVARCN